MAAEVKVEIQHVPLIKIAVHKRLLAPIVVSDLFPNLAGLASHGQEPVIPVFSKRNVFDWIPKILSFRGIGKKTPVVVLAKQVICPRWCGWFSSRSRLGLREQRSRKKHYQDR